MSSVIRLGTEANDLHLDQGAAHPHQPANVPQVFQSGDRRLGAKLALRRRKIERRLEHRIAAQRIGVDAVLVAGGDHQQPEPDGLGKAVGDMVRTAWIDQAGGKLISDPKPLFDLPQRPQSEYVNEPASTTRV